MNLPEFNKRIVLKTILSKAQSYPSQLVIHGLSSCNLEKTCIDMGLLISELQVHFYFWIHTLRAGFGFIRKKTCNIINCINKQLCKKYSRNDIVFTKIQNSEDKSKILLCASKNQYTFPSVPQNLMCFLPLTEMTAVSGSNLFQHFTQRKVKESEKTKRRKTRDERKEIKLSGVIK